MGLTIENKKGFRVSPWSVKPQRQTLNPRENRLTK